MSVDNSGSFKPENLVNALEDALKEEEEAKQAAARAPVLPPNMILVSNTEYACLQKAAKQAVADPKPVRKGELMHNLLFMLFGGAAAMVGVFGVQPYFQTDKPSNPTAQPAVVQAVDGKSLERLTAELEHAKKSAAESNKQMLASRAEYSAVKNERDSAKTSLEAAQKEVIHYKAKAITEGIASETDHNLLLGKINELAGVKIDREKYQKQNEELNKTVKQLNSGIDAYKKASEEQVADLKTRLGISEKQATNLKVEFDSYKKSVVQDSTQKGSRIQGLEKQLAELQAQNKTLSEEKAALQVSPSVTASKELAKYQKTMQYLKQSGGLISFHEGENVLLPTYEYNAYAALVNNLAKCNSTPSFELKKADESLPELGFFHISKVKAACGGGLFHSQTPVKIDPLSHLRDLDSIEMTELAFDDSYFMLKDLPSLKSARFTGCQIPNFTKLRNLPSFKELIMPHCTIGSLAGIENLSALENLIMDNADIGGSLDPIFDSKSIRVADLLNVRIPGLAGFLKMPSLKELAIAGSSFDYLTPENQDALKQLKDKGVKVIMSGEEYNAWREENLYYVSGNAADFIAQGNAFRKRSKFNESLADYRKAIKLDPANDAAHLGMGMSYHDLKQFDDAITFYELSIKLNPQSQLAHYNLGMLLNSKEKHLDAILHFNKVIELNPGFGDAYFYLGNTFNTLSRYAEAEAALKKAIAITKSDAAYNSLGIALERQDKLSDAALSYKNAIKINPECDAAYHNLGDVMRLQGKRDEAVACYKKAIELDTKFKFSYSNLADVLVEQGKKDEAKKYYKKAVDLGDNDAKTKLEELNKK